MRRRKLKSQLWTRSVEEEDTLEQLRPGQGSGQHGNRKRSHSNASHRRTPGPVCQRAIGTMDRSPDRPGLDRNLNWTSVPQRPPPRSSFVGLPKPTVKNPPECTHFTTIWNAAIQFSDERFEQHVLFLHVMEGVGEVADEVHRVEEEGRPQGRGRITAAAVFPSCVDPIRGVARGRGRDLHSLRCRFACPTRRHAIRVDE